MIVDYITNALDNSKWYAIQTKPQQEKKACFNLNSYGVETFFPQVRKKYKNNRYLMEYYLEPLFSRYIFAKFNYPGVFNKIKYTRGVQKIVGMGPTPCAIEEDVIDIIKQNCSDEGVIQTDTQFKPGDRVIINKPYLKDFIGVFQYETNKRDRVSILLTTISYQANMIIGKEDISKVS